MPVIWCQTVTRLRADQLRDGSGVARPQRDWPHADHLDIAGVSVQPVMTTEARDAAGVQVTDQWRLYTRRGHTVDIKSGDRVVWNGLTLDVLGFPEVWQGVVAGLMHHQEILLKQSPPTRQSSVGTAAVLHDQVLAAQNTQSWSP